MKRALRNVLIGASLLAFMGAAGAQDRDRDWYHHDRDDRWRGNEWRNRLFWQVREDLEHAQYATFPFGRDQYRIQRTKQELNELQDKMERGVYDQRELDEVIGALQRVVADNRMSQRDRDMLSNDLGHLREYREHHEGWGR